jgi:hypothetical protein
MTTLITHRHRFPRTEPAPRELVWLAAVIALTVAVMYGQNFLA